MICPVESDVNLIDAEPHQAGMAGVAMYVLSCFRLELALLDPQVARELGHCRRDTRRPKRVNDAWGGVLLGGDNLYRDTGNVILAQQLLRHESIATTQGYLHPAREDLAEALAALHKERHS
jgi:hypothetical protein